MMDNDDTMLNNCGPQSGAETVYGTEDNNMVMSEKNEQVVSIVQQLAGSIYQEFERMINRYDEDVVKNLMPLLVNVLECLDASYRINQEQDVEVELLREDNEQLVTQYEREKSARKQSEQKLLEAEDLAEQENKELASRLESLESIVRMLELKHKNSVEHASRLEEREADLKKEYARLHERYTELFKNHVDYMERTKMLMGSTHSQMSNASDRMEVSRARLNPVARSSGPVSYGFASLENSVMLDTETICSVGSQSDDSGPPSLQNELDNLAGTVERSAATDALQQQHQATSPQSPDMSPVVPNVPANVGRSTTKKEQRSDNNLYQELSFQDNEESEENEIVTGSWVHPGEYASSANDNYFGMGKEVENLIMENNELLATKNALNIVKDDLIVKVDELTGEVEIVREELNAMQQSRTKLRQRIGELEDELKKTKEQVKQQSTEQEENDVPLAQRKRFTRVEMAMVLMERNQYKERLMELQEAVRLTEILRASRTVDNLDKKSKQGIWQYFSNLFTHSNRSSERGADGLGGGPMFRHTGGGSPAHSHGSPSRGGSDNRLAIAGSQPPPHPASAGLANALIMAKDYSEEGSSERINARRREQYRQLRAHVQKEDGRLHAYGWSLPINKTNQDANPSRHSGGVPVPVYCNPLAEASPHMKVFCAAGVNLQGGFTKDGQSLIPPDSPYAPRSTLKIAEITSPTAEHSAEALDRQMARASLETLEPETQLSSFVWICTSTHAASTVSVVDANQSATVLDAFPICASHLLCIASVQGAMESDYALLEQSEVVKAGEMLQRPGEGTELLGKVEFVRVKPKSDQNSNSKQNSLEEEVPAPITVVGVAVAKEATEKSNEQLPAVDATEPLANVEAIKIRQALPGAPQRLPSSSDNNSHNHVNNNNSSNNVQFSIKSLNPILGTKEREEPAMSSVGPTMWLGAQDGWLYVHSSVGRWHECLHKVLLPDAVLAIVHVEARVVVALANAQLAVFRRQTDGQWDLNSYHLVTVGDRNHSIRCLCVAGERIWAAHRNKIFIVDPISLNIVHSLDAHPRKESQVRQMAATGAGVWVSIRLDSTLRLYNTHTFEHKQDVDIEPYVSKMLGTGKLGFSFVRITALMVSCNRLWIGTSNGVIISVPLAEMQQKSSDPHGHMPLCCMANAQLSFHGHRDAVKFFVSVPMLQQPNGTLTFSNKRPDMLVMCGGEGYIDFRIRHEKYDASDNAAHLIVWKVDT
ncbi:JNK-interacting protein 3 isoform X8 [Drosophila novamexicana]|uniref:JNK-interacting protein 3 isoform X7 n=1 Tax=Drosophila novamexicana TaxID=47314 RepID=UPI0011E5BEA1|nr:JNK-interacting protein 3 isoform X7 [Drosophila novamexicana]XP_030571585.1 JNK-interacting protein 3 isoform X8 [Drosophila novamexicana]